MGQKQGAKIGNFLTNCSQAASERGDSDKNSRGASWLEHHYMKAKF